MEDKARVEELKGKKAFLESQCYLLKKALEVNELELGQIATVLGEYERRAKPPPAPEEEPPDA